MGEGVLSYQVRSLPYVRSINKIFPIKHIHVIASVKRLLVHAHVSCYSLTLLANVNKKKSNSARERHDLHARNCRIITN